jgi:hypothetical protein
LGALSQLLCDGLKLIHPSLEKWQLTEWHNRLNELILGPSWMGRTVMFVWDPIFMAAGAITGMRVCLSMVVAGTLCWAVFVPLVQSTGLTSSFAAMGFKDDAAQIAFVEQVRAANDPVSVFVWSSFSEPLRQTLLTVSSNSPPPAGRLAGALDRITQGSVLHDPTRFAGVALTEETKKLLKQNPEGGDRVRLNRLLLEDAYPKRIARSSSFRGLVQWTLWGGTACMVSAGLLNFLLQWRTSLRAFKNLGKMFRRGGGSRDPMDEIEAPTSWFLAGQVLSLIAIGYLAKRTFGIPYWIAGLALVLSFVLALVACRVTGETDTTPVGAMGQITQLTIGALHPGSATTTLMSANIVSSAAISSADLLTDLKSGYLLGANPRKQFLAQFSGIFIGTVVTVLAFSVMVPKAEVLGSDQFPAPAAQNWRAVALAMSQGVGQLHPMKKWSIGLGAALGVTLALLPVFLPKQQNYIPSAAGVGLAWTFHWYYGFLFFLGALIAYGWNKKFPKNATEFLYPVASGVIAGGSLMGVLLIFWENGPEMWRKIFGG